MKKLQNNFTTLEQSKRLLELGVPFDSADCYYEYFDDEDGVPIYGDFPQYGTSYVELDMPCWSVGRLVEIYVIARGIDTSFLLIERGKDMVQYLIRLYEDKVKDLDFSKLED